MDAEPSSAPWVLVTGQSHDPRWQASNDGTSLDVRWSSTGTAPAGSCRPGGRTTLAVAYGPQRSSDLALVVSLVAALGCLVALPRPLLRRRPAVAAVRAQPSPPTRGQRHAGPAVPRAVRLALAAAGTVLLAWFVADWTGAVAAAAALVAMGVGVRPARVAQAGVAVAVLVPVVWIAGNRYRMPAVTVDLVQDVPWAGRLAAVALVLMTGGGVRPAAGAGDRTASAALEDCTAVTAPDDPAAQPGPGARPVRRLGTLAPPPEVSVVVTTKNVERTLEACLRSVLAQDYPSLRAAGRRQPQHGRDGGDRQPARRPIPGGRSGAKRAAQHRRRARRRAAGCCGSTPTWCSPRTWCPRLVAQARPRPAPVARLDPGAHRRRRLLDRLPDARAQLLPGRPGAVQPAAAAPGLPARARRLRPVDVRPRGHRPAPAAGTRTAPRSATSTRSSSTTRAGSPCATWRPSGCTTAAACRRSRRPTRGAVRAQGRATLAAFGRHRRQLLADPAHAAGLLLMRSVEAGAYAVGAWQGRRTGPR